MRRANATKGLTKKVKNQNVKCENVEMKKALQSLQGFH
jgi:hypothetical protein